MMGPASAGAAIPQASTSAAARAIHRFIEFPLCMIMMWCPRLAVATLEGSPARGPRGRGKLEQGLPDHLVGVPRRVRDRVPAAAGELPALALVGRDAAEL